MSDDEKKNNDSEAENTSVLANEKASSTTVTFGKLKPKSGQLVLKMYTPYKTFFEGDVKSVSALNDTGEFDVLAGHHNFITMLKPCDVSIQLPDKTVTKIPIQRGLMHVKQDKVMIFLDV